MVTFYRVPHRRSHWLPASSVVRAGCCGRLSVRRLRLDNLWCVRIYFRPRREGQTMSSAMIRVCLRDAEGKRRTPYTTVWCEPRT